jgi:hypothetical protein
MNLRFFGARVVYADGFAGGTAFFGEISSVSS